MEQVAGKIGKIRLKSNVTELKLIQNHQKYTKWVFTCPNGRVTIEDFDDKDTAGSVTVSKINYFCDAEKFEAMLED